MLRHTSRVLTSLWNWHNSFIPSIARHSNAVSQVSKPELLTSAREAKGGASDTDDVCMRKQDAAELPLITHMITVAALTVPTCKEWRARGEIQSVASDANHFPFEWLWRSRAFQWRIVFPGLFQVWSGVRSGSYASCVTAQQIKEEEEKET